MLMNVLPGPGGWDGEVYPHILQTNWLPVDDSNDQWFTLGTDPRMDSSFASDQSRNAESAPNAWRPPIVLQPLNPMGHWCRRKGVNQPRLAYVRAQNNSMGFSELGKELFNLGNGHL